MSQQQAPIRQSAAPPSIADPLQWQEAEYHRRPTEWIGQLPGLLRPPDPDPSALRADSPTAKAEALLRQRLGDAEWGLFQTTRTLTRPSRLWPSVFYRFQRGEPVQAIRDGQLAASLCVVARQGEPEADRLLTILDLIETDERRLWEMANLTHLAPHQPTLGQPATKWQRLWIGCLLITTVVFVLFPWVVRWLR